MHDIDIDKLLDIFFDSNNNMLIDNTYFKSKSKENIHEAIKSMSLKDRFKNAIENRIRWLAEDCIRDGLDMIYIIELSLNKIYNDDIHRLYLFRLLYPDIVEDFFFDLDKKIEQLNNIFSKTGIFIECYKYKYMSLNLSRTIFDPSIITFKIINKFLNKEYILHHEHTTI